MKLDAVGIEPTTHYLGNKCSTAELNALFRRRIYNLLRCIEL